jgi:hypothetical protein
MNLLESTYLALVQSEAGFYLKELIGFFGGLDVLVDRLCEGHQIL